MHVASDLAQAIGNTPLIRLRKASEETGCEIYGKAEFMNPGQSVKDRAALFIIQDAIAKGTPTNPPTSSGPIFFLMRSRA